MFQDYLNLCVKWVPLLISFFVRRQKKNWSQLSWRNIRANFQSRLSQIKSIQKAGQSYHIRFSRVYRIHCIHCICCMQCMRHRILLHVMYATLHLSHGTNATSDILHTSHARTLTISLGSAERPIEMPPWFSVASWWSRREWCASRIWQIDQVVCTVEPLHRSLDKYG